MPPMPPMPPMPLSPKPIENPVSSQRGLCLVYEATSKRRRDLALLPQWSEFSTPSYEGQSMFPVRIPMFHVPYLFQKNVYSCHLIFPKGLTVLCRK
ncbi:hypothetical protein BofuT4_uP015260.1 [Botrytis cinerea T4]|uniref:Uncharacterized protein n=1 Tax=Botryotinia fuckeliana (strain T4) TaxID=999810 RepID=G2YHN3_BOTF4|nr:hypothetical protein BofuT4_uP015260.1 [Botrytis cinerea T4]